MNICKITAEGNTISHKHMGLNFSVLMKNILTYSVKLEAPTNIWVGDKSLGVELSLK